MGVRLKGALDAAIPTKRSLSTKVKEIVDYIPEVRLIHVRYCNDQKDILLRSELDAEFNEAMDQVEESLYAAQDKLEEFGETPEPIENVEASEEVSTARIEKSRKKLEKRLKHIKDTAGKMTQPNKSKIDVFQNMINDLRKETKNKVKEAFEKLYEEAKTKEKHLQLDNNREALIQPIFDELDSLEANLIERIPDVTPAVSRASSEIGDNVPVQSKSAYKIYQKPTMPKFKGEFREYADWKDEFKVEILPNFEVRKQIRLLNEYTPKEIELKNCSTVEEAWQKLDSKYANAHLITTILVEDYVKFVPRGRTPEAKMVDMRDMLVKMEDDLTSVNSQNELATNTWIHCKVVKDLPLHFQTKFIEKEDDLVGQEGSRWKALFKFIKDEALKIETKMSWRLDPTAPDSSRESASSKSSPGLDMHKLPKKLQRQVNAAISNYDSKSSGNLSPSSSVYATNQNAGNAPKSERFDEFAAKVGKCPECKELHTYTERNGEFFVSSTLLACNKFKSLEINKKAANVVKYNACAICLSWTHKRDTCKKQRKCGKRGCQLLHHYHLHGSNVAAVNAVNVQREDSHDHSNRPRFLHLVEIETEDNVKRVGFLDDGSDSCIIRLGLARDLNLKGTPETTYMETAGNKEEKKQLLRFSVPVKRNNGEIVMLSCLGLDRITSNTSEGVNIDEAYRLFPHVPRGALDRPVGEVDILIGQNYASLLASGGEGHNVVGDLRAMHCSFGSGWVLSGHHPSIVHDNHICFSETASALRTGRFSKTSQVNLFNSCSNLFPELLDIPLHPPRRCLRCRNCQSCRYEHEEVTRQEQEELQMIRDNTWLDSSCQRCFTRYPIIKSTDTLQYNEWQALSIAKSMKKHLIKNGQIEAYEAEMDDYLERDVLVPVSRKEIADW